MDLFDMDNTLKSDHHRADSLPKAEPAVLQVSQLNNLAKKHLEDKFKSVWIEGEISNLAQPQSGHIYLTLKDSQAQVKGAFFKQAQKNCKLELRQGQQVLVKAKVSLYAPRGDYQLIISQIQASGAGQLQQAFETLKNTLQQEGLFDDERKQPLPQHPKTIGIVTSPTGAALQDMLHILARRFPFTNIILYPSPVQGINAASKIATMIDTANSRKEVDLLVIGRGGGSLEDLWSFNEEIVARAIARSTLPTLSAVGHQTDFTIADFVADVRAPTPSAAAELAVPKWQELFALFVHAQHQLIVQMTNVLEKKHTRVQALARHIKHPYSQIQEQMQRLDYLQKRLQAAMQRKLHSTQQTLAHLSLHLQQISPQQQLLQLGKDLHRLHHLLIRNQNLLLSHKRKLIQQLGARLTGLGPQKTLERGYTIALDTNNNVIETVQKLKSKQIITLQFQDGEAKLQRL